MLVQVRPPPDPLLSGPICALRLMGAQCTWAVPAADQPQPDGRGGGCCPAAEAALSNCRPLRRTGTPAMRSWALQQPQPPRVGGWEGSWQAMPGSPGWKEGVGGLVQQEPETRALACLSLPPMPLLPLL